MNDGSPLVVPGLKTEGNFTVVNNRNCARTQILGGLLYIVQDATPRFPHSSMTAAVCSPPSAPPAGTWSICRTATPGGVCLQQVSRRAATGGWCLGYPPTIDGRTSLYGSGAGLSGRDGVSTQAPRCCNASR